MNTLLLVGAGAAALYFMSRPASAAINPATGLPYRWNAPAGVNPALWASQPSGVPGYTNAQLQAAVRTGGAPGTSPVARAIAAMGPGGLTAVIGGGASLITRLFAPSSTPDAPSGSAGAWAPSATSTGTTPAGADILRPDMAPVEDPWGSGGYTMPAGVEPVAYEDPWGSGGYAMPEGYPVIAYEPPMDWGGYAEAAPVDYGWGGESDWGMAGVRIPWTTGIDRRGDFDLAALGNRHDRPRVRRPSQYRGPI